MPSPLSVAFSTPSQSNDSTLCCAREDANILFLPLIAWSVWPSGPLPTMQAVDRTLKKPMVIVVRMNVLSARAMPSPKICHLGQLEQLTDQFVRSHRPDRTVCPARPISGQRRDADRIATRSRESASRRRSPRAKRPDEDRSTQ